ncbi:MAG: hypothetical protein AAGA09_09235 [Pseudomonadota bacterium]
MFSDATTLFHCATAPATDRRLSRRLIDAWARAARGHFPSWAAFQEMDLGDDWDWIFAIDIKRSAGFPFFVYVGDCLSKLSDVYLSGQTDFTLSLLDLAASDMYAAAAGEAPHFREDVLTLFDGRRIQFRAVTAPLADDGSTVSHVVGAANGRFVEQTPLRKV